MMHWTTEGLHKEIADLEGLLARTTDGGEDIDVRWARTLFEELLRRRREMLRKLLSRQR